MTSIEVPEELSADEAALYARIPESGATIGNGEARHRLRWPQRRYWPVRDALVDRGLVLRGRGQGGSVRRVAADPAVETVTMTVTADGSDPVLTAQQAIRREQDLYGPMAAVLHGDWAQDHRATFLAVENTASQGRRNTGGIWSRPDLVTAEVRTYPYVPGKFLEVRTFEVKPADAVNVQAVYEALAHRRSATHAYVLLHVPDPAAVQAVIDEIEQVARTHGIGLVTAVDPADYRTWDELVEAERHQPDPERLNTFIATQLGDDTRDKIARALR